MTYFIVALVAIAGIAVLVAVIQRGRIKNLKTENAELEEALTRQAEEIKRIRRAVEAQKEIRQNAQDKKSEIRDHADPSDRARAATNAMRDAAGRDNGDGSASSD